MALLNHALLVSLVIVTLIVVCTSVPLHGAKRDDIVQVSLLAEESNPDLRVRRAADSNLPDHLSFGFPVQGEQVELRLKRSRLLPTVTSDSTLNAGSFSQDAAVYTDIIRGSAMIVKRDIEGYTLKGSLVHANQEWSMEPVERERRDAGQRQFFTLHHFVPMDVGNRNMSFVGDAVVDTEEREELVKIWRRQGRGDNLQAGQQRNRSSLQSPRQAGERSQLLSQGQQHGLNFNERQNRGGNQRHKRAVTQHVVETAFIVDNADYKKWVAMFGAGNAVTEITLWYTFVAESLRIRYETIVDPDIAITTTVTILKILTNAEDSAFIDDITDSQDIFDGTQALGIFKNWVPLQADLPLSDHYMMFTGHDMEGDAAFGRAYRPGVCTSLGLSILENNFDGYVSKAAAHELGHSLNSKHDVEYSPDCEDATQNIMASKNLPYNPQNEGNRWRFSSCSIKAFKEYLSRVTCTLPENTSGDDELPYPAEGQKAGDRDAQCRRSQNYTDSYFCESIQVSLGIETLCRTMYCARDDGKCWNMTPEEYTPCNTGKWCKAGLCVDIPEQTTTTTTTTTTPRTTTTTPRTTTTTPRTTRTTPRTTTTTTTPRTTTTTTTPRTTSKTTTTTPPTTTTSRTTSTTSPPTPCSQFFATKDLLAFWNCVSRCLTSTKMSGVRVTVQFGKSRETTADVFPPWSVNVQIEPMFPEREKPVGQLPLTALSGAFL